MSERGDASPLTERYAAALRGFLDERGEMGLVRAHELGREAFSSGMGVLEIANVHSHALDAALRAPLGDEERTRVLDGAGQFFSETLSPFEMAHRGFWEANVTLHRLNEVLEGQAKRIASALHDEAAQLLASVHFALADIATRLPPEHAQEIQSARGLLDQIEERLRNLAHELRPPILDDLGLVPALEFLAETVSKRWGVCVTVEASVEGRIAATVETALYRITQEALTNVGKHAKAQSAHVSLRTASHRLACEIRDDGIGFGPLASAPEKVSRGLGLREIEERVAGLGGVMRLGSNLPHGSVLAVEIPLER